jgi:hypothetical protein
MRLDKLLAAASISFALGACATDHDAPPPDGPGAPTPTTFKLRIDNIAPWTVLESGAQLQKESGASGAAGPGDSFDLTFTAGTTQSVSFAMMFGESNDWFFAPGPAGIALYDAQGKPVSGDVTSQVALWNAGTELDQEPGVGDATGPNQPAPDYGAPDPDPNVRQLAQTVALSDGSMFTLPAIGDMIQVTLTPGANQQFTLHIANVSTAATLVTSQGARAIHLSPPVWAVHILPAPLFDAGKPDRGQGLELVAESGRGAMLTASLGELTGAATPISPGVFVVHRDPDPLYSLGLADRGQGLEHLAEDGNNTALSSAMSGIAQAGGVAMAGAFDTPVGAAARGAAAPGAGYEVTLTAVPGDHVSFATMFGMSDDWFFGTEPEGIALFDEAGNPVNGDVSDHVGIYDAGTELDEQLAIGPDTGPQQPAPNTGAADPVAQVRAVSAARYGQPASAHLRVTLTPQ